MAARQSRSSGRSELALPGLRDVGERGCGARAVVEAGPMALAVPEPLDNGIVRREGRVHPWAAALLRGEVA